MPPEEQSMTSTPASLRFLAYIIFSSTVEPLSAPSTDDILKNKGFSYRDISKYLLRNRHKNKSGGKWTRENVYSVLKTYLNNEKITLQVC